VSVIIPCYNQGHLVTYAIDSVLNQTRSPDEIIVVNDGSNDDTAAVCRTYEGLITYVFQANAGLSAARNTGILRARSEYVHLLDADDLMRPTALARLLDTAVSNPTASVIRGSWEEVTSDGTLLTEVRATDLGSDPFHALFDALAVGPPCRYMVRRESLLAAGLFDERLKSCEDWDMWLRVALAGVRFATSPDAVTVYRRHPQSMSRNHRRMWQSGTRVLRQADARHGCAICATRFRAGVRIWREYCYLSILRADVRAAVQQRKFGRAMALTVRAILYDPPVTRLLAASVIRSIRRSLRVKSAPLGK
jgi:glycosyltransferase involved in cell wall biosynthesis